MLRGVGASSLSLFYPLEESSPSNAICPFEISLTLSLHLNVGLPLLFFHALLVNLSSLSVCFLPHYSLLLTPASCSPIQIIVFFSSDYFTGQRRNAFCSSIMCLDESMLLWFGNVFSFECDNPICIWTLRHELPLLI